MAAPLNEKEPNGGMHCGLQRPGKECLRTEGKDGNCKLAGQCFTEHEILHRALATMRVNYDNLTIDGVGVIHRIVKIPHKVIQKNNGSCPGEIFTVYQKGPGEEQFSLGSSCVECGIVPDIFTPEEIFNKLQ